MAESPPAPQPRPPRVWLISSACNALGHAIALAALQLGESVAAGCTPEEIRSDGDGALQELRTAAGGSNRLVIVELDTRNIALCQSALAETVYAFRRIDVVLNCTSQSYVGTLEELPMALVLAQFEATYFGPVNMMRSAVPFLRKQRGGHIVNVTGLTGHMGTPGLSVRCASDHAVEGFSDSLSYEIAPFNIKVTIVQPPLEVKYHPPHTQAVGAGIGLTWASVLSSPLNLTPTAHKEYTTFSTFSSIVSAAPPPSIVLADTVAVIMQIAALENPPGRIVVGSESVEQVKDRLKTVSEELEEFLEASLGADIPKE